MLKTVLQHIRDGMDIPENREFVTPIATKPDLPLLKVTEWCSQFFC
jgi:hypothetical protein